MRGPKEMNVEAEEPDAEVELSAQDLRELSEGRDNNEHERCVPEGCAVAQANATTTTAAPSASEALATALRLPLSGLSITLVSLFAALGTLYVLMPLANEGAQPVAQNVMAQAPQVERRDSEPKTKGEPVRFSNPFDAHEVFEFAAGTSEDEAREAVAKLLMDRARERQQLRYR